MFCVGLFSKFVLEVTHLFIGRITMGLFGKTVPKTAGIILRLLNLVSCLFFLLDSECY